MTIPRQTTAVAEGVKSGCKGVASLRYVLKKKSVIWQLELPENYFKL